MKEDLHMWMNRKSMDKPMVRIHAYSKYGLDRPIFHPSPDSGCSVHRAFVFNDEPNSDAVSYGWPTRWQQSPLVSGLMIVSGAVMVGLLMGWTVLTLLSPIPAG